MQNQVHDMKKNIFPCGLLAAVPLFLASCGEDRTYEYLAKTETDNWIEAQMRDVYLYYQDMPVLETEDYFSPPEEFFPKILAPQDKYSYIEVPEEAVAKNAIQDVTYGFDFVMVSDPTSTSSRQTARVLQVLPYSPAEMAGLQRGDFIVQVNGENVGNNNADLLRNGGGVTLTVLPLAIDEETGEIAWTEDTLELSLAPAVAMENNPFYLSKVIEHNGIKAGYLMYNEFKADSGNGGLNYMNQMLQVFQWFKQQGVTEFVLDLRYNQGGQVNCAQLLAAMLVPANCLGQEFAHFVFNDKRQDLNYTLNLPPEHAACNLDLDRIFIISGLYTASASEMMVNCLRPYMTVNLLGTQTTGKNVAMTKIDSPYGFTMYPVTSTVYNKNGESDYAGGFTPEYIISELNYYPWFEIGDPNELLLRNTLQWMAGGIPADAENVADEEPEEGTTEDGDTEEEGENAGTEEGDGNTPKAVRRLKGHPSPGYSSITERHFPAAILPELNHAL